MERSPRGAPALPAQDPAEGPGAERGHAAREYRHTFTVPPTPESTRVARQQVRETLRRWDVDDTTEAADTVRLIVSELVTNAVQHAGHMTCSVAVTVMLDDSGDLLLGVRDGHPGLPTAQQVPLLACSGRGMDIVRTLLHEAGGHCHIEPHQNGGKVVWIQLSVTRRTPAT
ncbi:ATP-binding protein [Streptomyces chartreusis]|uniref:ATP-binding protein n=1 Tax=Streptomyces chartreusis TaxID=1969 RepID=UPI0038194944